MHYFKRTLIFLFSFSIKIYIQNISLFKITMSIASTQTMQTSLRFSVF